MKKIVIFAFFALIFSGVKAQAFHKLGPQKGDPIMYFLKWEPTADPMVQKAYEDNLPMLEDILNRRVDLAIIVVGDGFYNHGIKSDGQIYSTPLKPGTRCLAWRLDEDSAWEPFVKVGNNWCFNLVTPKNKTVVYPATPKPVPASSCDSSKIVSISEQTLSNGTIVSTRVYECGNVINEMLEPTVQVVKEEIIVQTEKVNPFGMVLHSGSLVGPETGQGDACCDQGKTKIKIGDRYVNAGFGMNLSIDRTQTPILEEKPKTYISQNHSQGGGSNGTNTTAGQGGGGQSNGTTTTDGQSGESQGGDNGSGTLQ